MSLNIVVVDSSTGSQDPDQTLAADRAIHPHAVLAGSVEEMVNGIMVRLWTGDKINILAIWGHGRPGMQGVGVGGNHRGIDHWLRRVIGVNEHGRLLNRRELSRLCGRFEPSGLVELHGCRVGRHHAGHELLRQLNNLWGVPVRAALDDQASDMGNRFFGAVAEASGGQNGHGARVHMVPAGVQPYWRGYENNFASSYWNIF